MESDSVRSVLGDLYAGMRLRYVVEEEPLGTAGPLRLALDQGVLAERLLVLNGDVLNDVDLTAEIEQHELTGARATLALVEVEDTTAYAAPAKLTAHLRGLPDVSESSGRPLREAVGQPAVFGSENHTPRASGAQIEAHLT